VKLIRSVLYVVWMYGAMAVTGFIGRVIGLVNPKAVFWAQRAWAKSSLFGLDVIAGSSLKIIGLENLPQGAFIFAPKHQAMIDIVIPFAFLDRPAFVLKQELLKTPMLGWYARHAGHLAIDREANASALRAMLKWAREIKAQGRPLVIFPEGTRAKPLAASDYKPGVAALYRDLNIPVAPVALDTGRIWPPNGYLLTPGAVTMKILPAIPAGLPREEFMARLQNDIDTESAALFNAPQPKRPNRLGLFAPWLIFLALAVGYWVYWSTLRDHALQRIDTAFAAVRANGGVADYRAVHVDGFPMRLSLHFADMRYAPKDAQFGFSAPRVTVHVNPAEPRHLIGAAKGPAQLTLGATTYVVDGDVLAASRRPARGGNGTEEVLDLRAVTLAGPNGAWQVKTLVIGARPDPRKAGDRQISVEFTGVVAPNAGALGGAIAEGHLRLVDEAGGLSALRVEGAKAVWGPATLSSETGRFTRTGAAWTGGLDGRIEQPSGAAPTKLTLQDGVLRADGVGELARVGAP
jgi:1-acyl-sn-glycerol-3-phosphate acyltransferase